VLTWPPLRQLRCLHSWPGLGKPCARTLERLPPISRLAGVEPVRKVS
jgi:hypothetical protein